jgi:glycosyltransferase involved in cell wall biosynthesis
MIFDPPVGARATTAIPETLGGAGLLVDPDDGALVIAEAMATVLTDAATRQELVGRGRRRLQDFDPDQARATFLDHLVSVV